MLESDHQMHLRVGKLDEDLVGSGHVELRDVRKAQKADVKWHESLMRMVFLILSGKPLRFDIAASILPHRAAGVVVRCPPDTHAELMIVARAIRRLLRTSRRESI